MAKILTTSTEYHDLHAKDYDEKWGRNLNQCSCSDLSLVLSLAKLGVMYYSLSILIPRPSSKQA
ncbi:MAG: hypothetical protein HQK52_23390 [Oligoflexia bacterium]|nr:hypothetical protein [Oligoflexia bacterium]